MSKNFLSLFSRPLTCTNANILMGAKQLEGVLF